MAQNYTVEIIEPPARVSNLEVEHTHFNYTEEKIPHQDKYIQAVQIKNYSEEHMNLGQY